MTAILHRLDDSIHAMAEYYPFFTSEVIQTRAGRTAVWTGEVCPLPSTELLSQLIDDLDNDRPVYLPGGGHVIHHPHCLIWKHTSPRWIKRVTNPHVRYGLKIQYSGGAANPRAYVKAPLLIIKNGQFHWKHMLEDGAICVYLPQHDVWHWQQHTVVDFMSHVLIWLVKWTVWSQTSVWIGREEAHDPYSLVRAIKTTAACWCGSGSDYASCHRKGDVEYVEKRPQPKPILENRIAEIRPRLFV